MVGTVEPNIHIQMCIAMNFMMHFMRKSYSIRVLKALPILKLSSHSQALFPGKCGRILLVAAARHFIIVNTIQMLATYFIDGNII